MGLKRSEHRQQSPWDAQWSTVVDKDPTALKTQSLENEIDELKFRFLTPVLPASGSAIEIGCGSAKLLARVGRAAGLELHAFDNSETALRVAAKTAEISGLPMTFTLGDARSLPFESKSFDIVLSGGLLEHFPDPRPVMSEMVRILRPGGVFYADVVPRRFSMYRIRESWRMLRSPWMMPGVYESTLGARFFKTTLEELGCSDVVVKSGGVYPPWKVKFWVTRTHGLDGTWVADMLGWYFMIRGRKQQVVRNGHQV